ncbi:MAG: hypothetical protein ACRDD7_04775 [Peptostreptococcaceae bacterium]
MNLKQIPIDQLVAVVNKELGNGLSVNKTCDKLGIKKTTLRDYMARNEYEYNREQHRYIKVDQVKVNKEPLKAKEYIESDNVIQSVTLTENTIVTEADTVAVLSIPSNDIEVLKEMISQYKKHKIINNVSGTIVVEMPHEENGDFRKTLRLNKTIYQEFEKFCSENKQFTIKELVSQALKEFIEKYTRE